MTKTDPVFSNKGQKMKKQLTLQQYRGIDLFLFALMLAVFEFIIIKVARSNFFWDQPYTVSLAAAIAAIVYMRWGAWGGIHAALAGLLFCLYSGGTGKQYIIYIVGNLFSLAVMLMRKKMGPEKIRAGRLASLLFALAVILLMQGGRAVVALILGASIKEAPAFFFADCISILFTLVIVWIVRRQDGIFEDQVHYLLRMQQEKE